MDSFSPSTSILVLGLFSRVSRFEDYLVVVSPDSAIECTFF
jgi:hypothetical protein